MQWRFEELLKSISIYRRNVQVLATELHKVHHELARDILDDSFNVLTYTENEPYKRSLFK